MQLNPAVLHLHVALNHTCGISRMIFLLGTNLQSTLPQHVGFCGGDALERFQTAGFPLLQLPGNKSVFLLPKVVFRIVSYCKKHNIGILHAHHRYFDLAGMLAAKILGIPLVTTVHSKVFSRKYMGYFADKIITPGENVKQHISRHFSVPENRISVLNNFIAPEAYHTADTEKLLQIKNSIPKEEDDKLILFVGRFSLEKGVDIIAQAVENLVQMKQRFHLLCIGGGEEVLLLEGLQKHFPENVSVLLPTADITPYYQIADIVLLPSRVDPYPLVMLESGYFGKALIAAAVDGLAEFLQHQFSALLVPPENPEALVAEIVKLFNSPDMRKMLGKNLHDTVLNSHMASHIIPGYLRLYRETATRNYIK